ncbi:hypothetical protein SAMN05444320_105245 [Streptoalloteichus hindustanus]|uniref:Uncharacterized protein n=1 Tax=Streptoalloteichus hindustanus TaxID=2017 RepID=A0A1M5F288_STRHI|nr:hypothetical protein SAMN05444320_105245 [Streptoalloteichus hindustanus]
MSTLAGTFRSGAVRRSEAGAEAGRVPVVRKPDSATPPPSGVGSPPSPRCPRWTRNRFRRWGAGQVRSVGSTKGSWCDEGNAPRPPASLPRMSTVDRRGRSVADGVFTLPFTLGHLAEVRVAAERFRPDLARTGTRCQPGPRCRSLTSQGTPDLAGRVTRDGRLPDPTPVGETPAPRPAGSSRFWPLLLGTTAPGARPVGTRFRAASGSPEPAESTDRFAHRPSRSSADNVERATARFPVSAPEPVAGLTVLRRGEPILSAPSGRPSCGQSRPATVLSTAPPTDPSRTDRHRWTDNFAGVRAFSGPLCWGGR